MIDKEDENKLESIQNVISNRPVVTVGELVQNDWDPLGKYCSLGTGDILKNFICIQPLPW